MGQIYEILGLTVDEEKRHGDRDNARSRWCLAIDNARPQMRIHAMEVMLKQS